MRKTLNEFVLLYRDNEEFQQKIESLQRVIDTDEWKTFKDVLVTIRGVMATDMFSHKFTSLDATEKDIMQRTYYNIDQMLEFLLRPMGWIRKQSKWEIYNTKLMAKAKGEKDGRK